MPTYRRRLTAVVAVLALTTLATGTASAGGAASSGPAPVSGPTLFDDCQSNDPTPFRRNSETEAMLAVNPADRRHFAAIWQQDRFTTGASRGTTVAVSRDTGRTWTRVAVPGLSCPATQGRTTNPWLAFAPNGDLYATATVLGAQGSVLVTKSTDGGATWRPATALIAEPRSESFSDKQAVTADPTDPRLVYTVWNRKTNRTGAHDVMLARSTDGGSTWEPARSLYSPPAPAGTVGNQIVVLRDGTLLNVFFQNDLPIGSPPGPTLTDHIKVMRSTDRGTTWSTPVTIADVRLNIPRLPDDGRVLVAPGLVPDIAMDPTCGTVYVVWGDATLATSASSVGLAASYDNGLTWTTPQRVDRAPESVAGGAGQAFLPQVDVAANGTVAVTYYDFRNNTADPGATTDLWMVTCRGGSCGRGGGRWHERHLAGPFDIGTAIDSFGGPFIGTYVGLAHAPGRFVATFVMTTGDAANPQDVYVTSTPATPRPPRGSA